MLDEHGVDVLAPQAGSFGRCHAAKPISRSTRTLRSPVPREQVDDPTAVVGGPDAFTVPLL